MAEAILSNLVTEILEVLGSFLVQEIGLASKVKPELRKMGYSLYTINAILLDAEKEGAMNDVVKDWLRKLKDAVYDTHDVLDEFTTEAFRQKVEQLPVNMVVKQVCRCLSCLNPLIFRCKMARRMKNIIESLDRIQKDDMLARFQFKTQSVDTDINDDDDMSNTNAFEIDESEVLGREEDKRKLVYLLTTSSDSSQENVMVIPIIGVDGIGKTTLAQYVYNDEKVKTYFDWRMWVCVSLDFNVAHLAKKIMENQPESEFRETLFGTRYLLVLDDVWNQHPRKWEDLRDLLIGGKRGSMILVTTNSQNVASIMHPVKTKYFLEGLQENECESLFNEQAFGKGKEKNHPELMKIGKDIVKKCHGVPLAAKALGSSLCLKRNIEDWLDVQYTKFWDLKQPEILPALKISYNHLPSNLKQCFAYCSIFPQGHVINVDDLIHQWGAHGFIQPRSSSGSTSHETLEDIGNRYFRELLRISFFQELREDEFGNNRSCKMHCMIHYLARWVAGMEWSEVDSGPMSMPTGVRHMVFHDKKSCDTSFENAQKLRTLQLHLEGDKLGITASFISSLRGLRVLQLIHLRIRHVPNSIGYLEQLRYLDLSRNNFQALPNFICRLYNLQTLRLKGCWKFNEWPRDMRKMVNLRHLELGENYSMKYMPCGLGQLASLQTLGHFFVGDPNNKRRKKSLELEMGKLGELQGLNQLRGYLSIEGLENVRDAKDAEEAKLKEKLNLHCLKLNFSFHGGNRPHLEDEQVLENLQPHPYLKALEICWYRGNNMPHWIIQSSSLLPNLVDLTIAGCKKLECLPLIGEFPCLRRLQLFHLHAMETINNKVVVRSNNNKEGGEGGGKLLVPFPLLQELRVWNVPKLERWTIEEEEKKTQHDHLHLSSIFPCLTDLEFRYCDKLTTVPMLSVGGKHLSSLRTLHLEGVERLVSLHDCPVPATLEELHIENCPTLVRLSDCFFENLKLLSKFTIWNCRKLTLLPEGIQHLTALKLLDIRGCPCLTKLPQGDLRNLTSLQVLKISDCPKLSLPSDFLRSHPERLSIFCDTKIKIVSI